MSAVTTSILIVGAVLLIALAVIYFGLVRRRHQFAQEALQRVRVGGIYPAARQQNVSTGDDPGNKLDSRRAWPTAASCSFDRCSVTLCRLRSFSDLLVVLPL